MSSVTDSESRTTPAASEQEAPPGALGRLGVAAASRVRLTLVLWLAVIAGLGALAP